MSDSPPHDEHEQSPGSQAAPDVEDVIAAAQDGARRLQEAAAELAQQRHEQRAGAGREAQAEQERELERARLAIGSLMSHIERVHAEVMASTDRIRRVADGVARAAEQAAEEQLAALRERVEAAGSAVDLIAAGMAAGGGEDAPPAGEAAAPADHVVPPAGEGPPPAGAQPKAAAATGADATPEPAEPQPLPADVAAPADALLAEDDGADAPAATPAPDAGRARLHAVNLALNGTPREETARELVEDFDLDGEAADALLDDVYRLADEAG